MRKGFWRLIRIAVIIHIVLAASLLLTHCSFSRYARKSFIRAQQEKPFDVIVVPGVPYAYDKTTSILKMRMFWAKMLYDSGFTKNIIFSGSAVYSPFVESVVMKVMADSLGIPRDHTFSEKRAEHSTENVYYSWKLAREMGFQKIALATDPFQSRMLKSFMHKYCPGMSAIPVVMDRLNLEGVSLPAIETSDAFVPGFISITQRESSWERFRGTMGKRVKDEVKEEGKDDMGKSEE